MSESRRSLVLRIAVAAVAITFSATMPACSSSTSSPTPAPEEDHVFGGARPLEVMRVPSGYDAKKPAPLVMVLHGYGVGGMLQNMFFNLASIADEKGFFLVAPDGTFDSTGKRFWNAAPECCDFDKTGVDDFAYLTGLLAEIEQHYAIDKKRIYLLGHSNGGVMAFRLACDAADKFAAVVDLAGPFLGDASRCKPSSPVAVRYMAGTADTVVPYDGGPLDASVNPKATGIMVPSALQTAEAWAGYDGCGTTPDTSGAPLDIDKNVDGAETTVSRYTGCRAPADVELWTIKGAGHVPGNLTLDLPRLTWDFFAAHPKP
jgi:polyhydroxybutyrate depolymerase